MHPVKMRAAHESASVTNQVPTPYADEKPRRHRIALSIDALVSALPWFVAGVFFWAFSYQIEAESLAGESDPGPRALPQTLGVLLIVGGLMDVGVQWIQIASRTMRLGNRSDGLRRESIDIASETVHDDASPSSRGLGATATIGLVIGYLIVMPWLGFMVTTWLLATCWFYFSRQPRWLTALMPAALVVAVILLFDFLFEVQLPRGIIPW